jgi:glucose/arabinose dehydrogenase
MKSKGMGSKNGVFRIIASIFIFFISNGKWELNAQNPELSVEKVLLSSISAPWGFTFIDSNELVFTEKRGKAFRYKINENDLKEINGLPAVSTNGQGGLLDVVLHPNFAENKRIYFTYAVNATGGQTTALGMGELNGMELQNFKEIFRAMPIRNSGVHFGSRLVFDRNLYLYMSIGDRGTAELAQDLDNHLGKVLRFKDDGSVPTDNPFFGVPNTMPEIFTWGNRNIQGMAMNPVTGEIYAHEHGPRGGDELNWIRANTNYGWPTVSFGVNYDGSQITPDTTLPGMTLPLTYWVPSIAPSGLTFVKNSQSENEFDVLIGALAGTHIHWLRMKDDKKVLSTRSLNGYARFRDIRQAPDGKLYAMTETPNRLLLLKSNITLTNGLNPTLKEINLLLFPNPGGDVLKIHFGNASALLSRTSVSLSTSSGMVLKQVDFDCGMHQRDGIQLNTEDLDSGIYLVEIENEGVKYCRYWIKS